MKVRKIVIIGISGTGKSTVSRELGKITGLPVFHMDSLIWDENWQEAPLVEVEKNLSAITTSEEWIVEGWIDQYSKDLLQQADVVYYLDYPGWIAMIGGLKRWWRYQGTRRPEMPAGCTERLRLAYLWLMLRRKERSHIEQVLKEVGQVNIVRCNSRTKSRQKMRELISDILCG